jgi:predicted kinase
VARGRLVILCGLPGSGKTTVAKCLEERHGAIRLCPDAWMAELGVDRFDGTVRERIERLQWQFARRLLTLGQRVLIEWGAWERAQRDLLRDGARAVGAAVELRVLDAPLEVLWERVQVREADGVAQGRPLTRADMTAYSASFQAPDAEELALYDAPDPPASDRG